jgi:hypothetical protein
MNRLMIAVTIAVIGLIAFFASPMHNVLKQRIPEGLEGSVQIYMMDSEAAMSDFSEAFEKAGDIQAAAQDVIANDGVITESYESVLTDFDSAYNSASAQTDVLISDLANLENEAQAMLASWESELIALEDPSVKSREMVRYDSTRREFTVTLENARLTIGELRQKLDGASSLVADVDRLIRIGAYSDSVDIINDRVSQIAMESQTISGDIDRLTTEIRSTFTRSGAIG